MKVLAYVVVAAGPVNTVIGLCQTLQERGHEITLMLETGFAGKAKKYGFNEIILEATKEDELQAENPLKYFAKMLKEMGVLSNRSSVEKMEMVIQNRNWLDQISEKCIREEPQVKKVIETIKPDVILVDHFMALPCILYGTVPWVYIWCAQPLAFYNSKQLPPANSGFPTLDRTSWASFEHLITAYGELTKTLQNQILAHFGHSPFPRHGVTFHSPYLNIYGYPKELDYQELVPMPSKTVAVDAFNRQNPQPYEWPVEFAKMLKPDDKLVYVSMGSMGSSDVELMKRITGALAGTPHKYIVSKGVRADEYDLPENMWGEGYLPQTSILPKVDLVITHGGNNSTTETICAGKPMIVMPLFMDQFDNAQRVAEVGFGVRIEPYGFEPEQLREAVNRLLGDEEVKRRVEKTAARIEKDNLKVNACIAIEQLVK